MTGLGVLKLYGYYLKRQGVQQEPGEEMSGPPGKSKMIGLAREEDFARFLKHFEEHLSSVKEEFYKKEKK